MGEMWKVSARAKAVAKKLNSTSMKEGWDMDKCWSQTKNSKREGKYSKEQEEEESFDGSFPNANDSVDGGQSYSTAWTQKLSEAL